MHHLGREPRGIRAPWVRPSADRSTLFLKGRGGSGSFHGFAASLPRTNSAPTRNRMTPACTSAIRPPKARTEIVAHAVGRVNGSAAASACRRPDRVIAPSIPSPSAARVAGIRERRATAGGRARAAACAQPTSEWSSLETGRDTNPPRQKGFAKARQSSYCRDGGRQNIFYSR
jgi:hypothetical protein